MTVTKEITTKQYADYRGCTAQNISKHIRNGKMNFLPDVLKVNKYSRFVLLVVPLSLDIQTH